MKTLCIQFFFRSVSIRKLDKNEREREIDDSTIGFLLVSDWIVFKKEKKTRNMSNSDLTVETNSNDVDGKSKII